jgi:hypothetical protein
MAEPVDDALFADIAPHYAERAQADLIERADEAVARYELLEALDELLSDVPLWSSTCRDPRKHDDGCHARHADCLASRVQDLIGE